MWDIGGQDSLRNSWNTYFADSDFVIFVVDSTDRERLPISKMEVRFFREKLSEIGNTFVFFGHLINNYGSIISQ